MKLSVVIPAYKEQGRIGPTLQKMSGYFSKQPYQWEILVCIDGSPDKTAEVVQGFSGSIPNLKIFNNPQNHGKGWVVRQGMMNATGDVRLFTDADNSTSIEQVEKLLPYINQDYDAAIGSIEVAGAKVNEHAQWYRRAFGHWSKYLIRLVAGLWGIHDTQRGFKLFTAKAAQAVFGRAKIDRFGFDIEILAIATNLGFKIKEVPVVWENAGDSTVSLSSYFEVLKDLFRVRWYLWTGKYNRD
ncbi:MAG: glycosyltransferase family 2 protein [Candidatus Doudnabacteria bacterium]|nr:glycosyltransferase family 2 protein [Candidatus Doudnabacteria bacterium]